MLLRSAAVAFFCFGVVAAPVLGADEAPKKPAQANAERAGKGYPPKLDGAEVQVYKTIGDVKLNAYIYKPADWKASDQRPAIVFFFGGGWTSGSPAQFQTHCKHLASRGMVAITADYRVKSRHGVTPDVCVADAKSAIRWTRANAAKLGIDPEKIAAAGGSAGGHVAACTGVLTTFDEPSEDAKVSSRPNAMILFNPALDTVEFGDRMNGKGEQLSPLHNVKAAIPPTIIFHGKADSTVSYASAERFEAAAKKAGGQCRLVGYEEQKHGFFNYRGADGGEMYKATVGEMDKFIESLGWLKESGRKE